MPKLPQAQVAAWAPEAAAGVNRFGVDLYRELAAGDALRQNLCISPISIQLALSMLREGAMAETAAEMDRLLHLPAERPMRQQALLQALGTDEGGKEAGVLALANGIWVDDQFEVRRRYLDVLWAHYGATAFVVDFADERGTSNVINAWVANRTGGKVAEAVASDGLRDVVAVLANAAHFRARWKAPFPSQCTQKGWFYAREDQPGQRTPFMVDTRIANVTTDHRAQVLELPYRDGRFAMLLVLPRHGIDLAEFRDTLTTKQIDQWVAALRRQMVAIVLPRWDFRFHVDLLPRLRTMGMSLRDLSGVAPGELVVSRITHEAAIDVDEEGTEAAAVTVVSICRGVPPDSVEFLADRPFLFLIRDRRTGAIAFLGHVAKP